MSKKKKWCEVTDKEMKDHLSIALINIEYAKANSNRPKEKIIRCPRCNKRLSVIWIDCGDNGCWHPYINKHKEK